MKVMNIRKELRKALKKAGNGLVGDSLDLYKDICSGCVLLAEENLSKGVIGSENAALCRTFIHYAGYLEGFDHMLDFLSQATERMEDTFCCRPRLRLRLARLRLTVLRRIECICGHDLSTADDVSSEVAFIERNIGFADRGELHNIREEGRLLTDPVEWTERWEEVIDEVEDICADMLKKQRKGMGFCFALWHAKAEVLRERFGIEWRSPAVMNPRVRFD